MNVLTSITKTILFFAEQRGKSQREHRVALAPGGVVGEAVRAPRIGDDAFRRNAHDGGQNFCSLWDAQCIKRCRHYREEPLLW